MKIVLDGRKMTDREAAHTYLQEVFGFPAHYGRNLDALCDCLTEGEIPEIEVQYEAELLAALGKYGERLLQVFADVQKK